MKYANKPLQRLPKQLFQNNDCPLMVANIDVAPISTNNFHTLCSTFGIQKTEKFETDNDSMTCLRHFVSQIRATRFL